MLVPFVLRGRAGEVRVDLRPNPDPSDWLDPASRQASGIPWERAGYQAMSGWVQLVRSSDSVPDLFEMDPTPITAGLDLPYCWFGTKPTLFDAPSRDTHADLDWRCRSFLCASPEIMRRTIVPIAAFEWGFDIRDGSVVSSPPTALPLTAWNEHTEYMTRCHPSWTFEPAPAGTP
jgi:hypothetical protein